MGWTGMSRIPEDRREFCRNELGANYEVLADSMVGGTWYAAVKHLAPERSGQVFAAIFLTKIGSHGGQREFLLKSMDESAGPCESKCPKKILDLLTPLADPTGSDKYAADWRLRCRDNLAAKKVAKTKKLERGDVVYLPQPVRFGDGQHRQKFTVVFERMRTSRFRATKNPVMRFAGEDGVVCQISRRLQDIFMTPAEYAAMMDKSARMAITPDDVTMPAMF